MFCFRLILSVKIVDIIHDISHNSMCISILLLQRIVKKTSKRTLQSKRQILKRSIYLSDESSSVSSIVDAENVLDLDLHISISPSCEEKSENDCVVASLGDDSMTDADFPNNDAEFLEEAEMGGSDQNPYSNPIENTFVFGDSIQEAKSLNSRLASWAVDCGLPHIHLRSLLGVLRSEGIDLPKDPRTLLQTPRSNNLIQLKYGTYNHYGIERGLRQTRDPSIVYPSVLNVVMNIDDVPINKTTSMTVISGCLENSTRVFLIGAFLPNKEAMKELKLYKNSLDYDDFLKFPVDEFIDLYFDGIELDGKQYTVMFDFLSSDAVAKSKILKVKAHTGFESCTKCKVKGKYLNRRTYFDDLKARKRTNDEEFAKSKSAIKRIPQIRMVTDVVLDYMHLVLLGVMKKILLFFYQGQQKAKARQ